MNFPFEYKEGRIYTNADGTCTVSYREQWICGVYGNAASSQKAIDCVAEGEERVLQSMWESRGSRQVIKCEDFHK